MGKGGMLKVGGRNNYGVRLRGWESGMGEGGMTERRMG